MIMSPRSIKELKMHPFYNDYNNLLNVPNIENDHEYEKHFIFKEITQKNEFLQMFALRYLVYRFVHFIEPNEAQLDIDCYDLFSKFMGVFEVFGKTERLIGTIRIISGDQESLYTKEIKSIVDDVSSFQSEKLFHKPKLFPIMETFTIPEKYLKSINSNGSTTAHGKEKPVELSRLALLPEYWSTKPRIEYGLHKLVIMESMKSVPDMNYYFIATHPRTRKKYQRLHFEIIPGTKECVYKNIKQLAIAMVVKLEDLVNNPPYGDQCKSLFDDYKKKGLFKI